MPCVLAEIFSPPLSFRDLRSSYATGFRACLTYSLRFKDGRSSWESSGQPRTSLRWVWSVPIERRTTQLVVTLSTFTPGGSKANQHLVVPQQLRDVHTWTSFHLFTPVTVVLSNEALSFLKNPSMLSRWVWKKCILKVFTTCERLLNVTWCSSELRFHPWHCIMAVSPYRDCYDEISASLTNGWWRHELRLDTLMEVTSTKTIALLRQRCCC